MFFSKHTFGSLFAGVGGFDMGFEQAGWDCRFQVEWDKHCQSVLNRHWPDVPKWGDVSETSGHELPAVDCIIFGSPCQDLSVAGKRAGLDGERSGLFHEAMRIIKEMRDATQGTSPKWIVWENVAGALHSNRGADFGTVLNEMAAAGALGIEWAVLDAQHFGVPQRRRRVFVVACFDTACLERSPDPLLPVQTIPVRDTEKDWNFTFYTSQGRQDRFTRGLATSLKTAGTICVAGPTINPRKLTPVECERLMGWPDDHTKWNAEGKEQSDTHRYKQCGNGVASPVAQWIAEHMRRVDEIH